MDGNGDNEEALWHKQVKWSTMVGLFSLQMVDLDSKVKLKQLLSIKEDVKSKATTGAY